MLDRADPSYETIRRVAAKDARYAALLQPEDRPAGYTAPVTPVSLPCIHRGEPTGESVLCPSCRGSVKVKLFACSEFGSCTLAKKVDGHGCCAGCVKYAPQSGVA